MRLTALRNFWSNVGRGADDAPPSATPPSVPSLGGTTQGAGLPVPPAPWGAARIAVLDRLFGEGFLDAGGAEEVMRVTRPLGLSEATSLLLLGAGTGGPVREIASEFGAWINAYEAQPELLSVASMRCTGAGLGKRAVVAAWDPTAPSFTRHGFHHALALVCLRGAPPGPVLEAIAAALKPDGQFVLIERVAGETLAADDPGLLAWSRLEGVGPALPTEAAIARSLARLGFDVRVRDDMTDRHLRLAVGAWRHLLAAMAGQRPPREQAALLVAEAERWLRRARLMREGKMRLLRWHAIRWRNAKLAAPG